MKAFAVSFRVAAATAFVFAASAAHADLSLPFNCTKSNSVQTFTQDNLDSFDLVNLSLSAKGNATPVGEKLTGGNTGATFYRAYNFPVTKVVVGSNLAIKSGSAAGSALFFDRTDDDTGAKFGLTLANFTIDYVNKVVTADITPMGGVAMIQQPIYTFEVDAALALKYKFPLTVTGHEVLKNLALTPVAKGALISALRLPDIALAALDFNFGTLTQDISTNLRSSCASSKAYVAK